MIVSLLKQDRSLKHKWIIHFKHCELILKILVLNFSILWHLKTGIVCLNRLILTSLFPEISETNKVTFPLIIQAKVLFRLSEMKEKRNPGLN